MHWVFDRCTELMNNQLFENMFAIAICKNIFVFYFWLLHCPQVEKQLIVQQNQQLHNKDTACLPLGDQTLLFPSRAKEENV